MDAIDTYPQTPPRRRPSLLCRVVLAALGFLVMGAIASGLAAQDARLVFATGKLELSPERPLTRGAVTLPVDQLVGVAAGWAIVEIPHATCESIGEGSSKAAKERWILGPGAIHTVRASAQPCKISSERRLQQVMAGLETCGSSCAFSVTVVAEGVTAASGEASETRFLELLQASPLAAAGPRHTDALGLETAVIQARGTSLCERYAASAVAQQVENVSKSCGLAGSGWSDDPAVHLSWCRGAGGDDEAVLERRRTSRRRVLDRCRPRSLNPECGEFAAAAAALQDGNLWQGCGLEGSDWNADFDHHYAWCTTAQNRELSSQVLALRRAKVEGCRRR